MPKKNTKNPHGHLSIREIEFIIKIFLLKKLPGPSGFTDKFLTNIQENNQYNSVNLIFPVS